MNEDSQKPTLTIKGVLRLYLLYELYLLFFLSYRAELDSLFVIRTIRVLKKLKQQSRVRLHIRVSFELFVFFKSQAGCVIPPTDQRYAP